jgi:MFS family permease
MVSTLTARIDRMESLVPALRSPAFRRYLYGQSVSLTGSWLQFTALMAVAFELTGRASTPGSVAAAYFGSIVVFSNVGGIIADRLQRRSVIIVSQLCFLFMALLLGALIHFRLEYPWQLVALSAINGGISAIEAPARLAFFRDMVPAELLMNAIAINAAMFNATRGLGAVLAGWLIAEFGIVHCFLLNAASYVFMVWALLGIHLKPPHRDSPCTPDGQSSVIRHVARSAQLRWLFVLLAIAGLLGWSFEATLPAFAVRGLEGSDSTFFSMMVGGLGLGAFSGGILVVLLANVISRRKLLFSGLIFASLNLIALARSEQISSAIASCVLIGLGLSVFGIGCQSSIQLAAGALPGRVMGLYTMVMCGSLLLGDLLLTVLADQFSERSVFLCAGFLCLVAGLSGIGSWLMDLVSTDK